MGILTPKPELNLTIRHIIYATCETYNVNLVERTHKIT